MNEEEELCDKMEAADVNEPSAFYKAAWANALKLNLEELQQLRDRMTVRVANKKMRNREEKTADAKEQKKMEQANKLYAEMKLWKGAERPKDVRNNRDKYYLWEKWNKDNILYLSQRTNALKVMEEAGINVDDAEAGAKEEPKPKPKPKPKEEAGAKVKQKEEVGAKVKQKQEPKEEEAGAKVKPKPKPKEEDTCLFFVQVDERLNDGFQTFSFKTFKTEQAAKQSYDKEVLMSLRPMNKFVPKPDTVMVAVDKVRVEFGICDEEGQPDEVIDFFANYDEEEMEA